LSRTAPVVFGDTVKATVTFGAIGLERLSDGTINTVLLGQNLAFARPGVTNALGGVVGTGIEYRPSAHWAVSGEGTVMNDKNGTGIVESGLRAKF
jgi:hypothetical protein